MTVKQHSPGFLALVAEAKKEINEIDIETYRKMRASGEPHLLIDVREDNEFAAAHAAGATHLSKGIIERDIEATIPDKSTRLVLYCGGGYRSALATASLQKMGYRNVISLDGGWHAYEVSGMPIEGPLHNTT
jgi:rhodanese-related sulfurtransferase